MTDRLKPGLQPVVRDLEHTLLWVFTIRSFAMSRAKSSRRGFLKRAAALAGTGAMAPYCWTTRSTAAEAANDRVNVASIGTSIYANRWGHQGEMDGRGSVVGHQAGRIGNMVAVADVNRRYAERFASKYDGRCQVYQDYRELLDRNDVEAVTIGTPDHWHTKIAIEAMQSGKDVYCEKPLTLTIDEGKKLCRVTRQTGRVFQVGTQQRSEYGRMFLKAVVLARSGRLGTKLHALSSVGQAERGGPFENQDPPAHLDWDFWLGQAPKVPYCPQRCDYDFRWWLEYSGGQVTDWGVHHTDIAMWALGVEETGPVEIEGTGDFPDIPNGYNVAHTFDCNMKFASGNTIRLYSGENELVISGDKGRIRVNRGGLTGKPVEELTPDDEAWLDVEILKLCHGWKTGGNEGDHMQNFFDSIKDRSLPISDVFTHHRSVSACHLANIAMRLKRKVRWDPDKEDFLGDEEASALLSRKQREPYTIDV
jgi:predicted dehydrogenase